MRRQISVSAAQRRLGLKLGGHQTFPPRPGWLTKGMQHLQSRNPGSFSDPATADGMGVGSNMSKSIGWWLGAMGLAGRESRGAALELSSFGEAVARHDPFMTHLETLWLVHASAMACDEGTTLPWFLSPERPERFARQEIADALSRAIAANRDRVPSQKRVQSEVSVVMRTYAAPVPAPGGDPEDNLVSPFHRLGLFSHVIATDRFERTGNPTPAPPEALGLLLSAGYLNASSNEVTEGRLLTIAAADEAALKAGAFLGLSRERILGLAASGAALLGKSKMNVESQAGERIVTLRSASAASWAERLYERLRSADRKAA